MSSSSLPEQIEALVDRLRQNRNEDLSMADVAAITEVLIGSMRMFFRGIDTKIYRECRAMSEYIMNARHEIASLQPRDLESARIPRAGQELDAIVQQTEEATNTIMESAEAIMNADPADSDEYRNQVQDHILRIFEACSFQDITGQRISKVVETLTFVEDRVHELRTLMGVTETDMEAASYEEQQTQRERHDPLARGPSLEGEGIDQSLVDELLGGDASAAPATPAPQGGTPSAPAPSAQTPSAQTPSAQTPSAQTPPPTDTGKGADDQPSADPAAPAQTGAAGETGKAGEAGGSSGPSAAGATGEKPASGSQTGKTQPDPKPAPKPDAKPAQKQAGKSAEAGKSAQAASAPAPAGKPTPGQDDAGADKTDGDDEFPSGGDVTQEDIDSLFN
ncbi:chemotaxis regulatin CheY-phosphate phosphatase CheZ [Rhodothalassium salexigens DSM 2132]|uniref:Chemotaxis regulatin CheY-phosphate phosphatase CheZ n=1 Tax=Rhodothalassium salexigens DSM 2132 TaxID=1188247 RepID=A0A4R2PMG6_RHOSA|nr:protein phosphatase CheZ [Rhodothalassium salexigens]MBB4211313.1 chemotaxis regulatin CheY-phosphate phosphatase CheZ [Rhodothalassium salexigens DSM 2132]TCP35235.1 chemotaxis regulatin CheY-phosphate phosphatase CheZ [Rhodothalassium salexigens DSM 2132]